MKIKEREFLLGATDLRTVLPAGIGVRRETQGVGLGLAIVKYITEAHGGRVHVRSAVGAGSRFTIELPLTNPPLSTANERS